jgi:hypothetical protein
MPIVHLDLIHFGEPGFADWKGKVVRLVEGRLQVDSGDADGIVCAQGDQVSQAWSRGISPKSTAAMVIKAGCVKAPKARQGLGP